MLQRRVVGGVFVEVTHGWVVETGTIEQFSVGLTEQGQHSDVDHLGGLFADGMNADESQVVTAKNQFKKPFSSPMSRPRGF